MSTASLLVIESFFSAYGQGKNLNHLRPNWNGSFLSVHGTVLRFHSLKVTDVVRVEVPDIKSHDSCQIAKPSA